MTQLVKYQSRSNVVKLNMIKFKQPINTSKCRGSIAHRNSRCPTTKSALLPLQRGYHDEMLRLYMLTAPFHNQEKAERMKKYKEREG